MADLILPEGFAAPTKIKRETYTLEILGPKHNEMDYEAWSSSKDSLTGIFGPNDQWPHDVTSLDQNLADLENHYREFEEKIAYAYTILDPSEKLCIGCLYIRPTPAPEFDCRVDYWFRDSHKQMEEGFFAETDAWLGDEWELKKVAYPGKKISWDEYTHPIR